MKSPALSPSRTGNVNVGSAIGRTHLVGLIFLQMLPATLVAPAVRPLFAAHHAGNEHAMHAFMSVNMIGAIVAAPLLARYAARLPYWVLPALAVIDALLLALIGSPVPTHLALLLRLIEGGAHVGLATLIMTVAARAQVAGDRRAMPAAGAALMFAVALGSALGGVLVAIDVALPFLFGSGLLIAVAAVIPRGLVHTLREDRAPQKRATGLWTALRDTWVPVSAAFVSRFTIGCIVVSFALFAHHAHGFSDRQIGLLFTAMTFPFALSMYPAGRVAARTSPALALSGGGIVYALCLLALGHVSAPLVVVIMVAAGVASAFIFAPTLCYAATLAGPGQRSRVMALIQAAGCVGMLIGPPVAGLVIAMTKTATDPTRGYRSAFFLAVVALSLWLVVTIPWIARQVRAELSARRKLATAEG